MDICFGLIGCGFISRKHLKALASCSEGALLAVSDIDEERMEAAKTFYREHSGRTHQVKCYKDYKAMLSDQEVDAVIIATISGLHAEMAKEALQANKHVILEKPMALSIEDSNELIRLARLKQKQLMICHQLRFLPIMQKVKSVLDEGKLGKLLLGTASIRLNRSPEYYASAAWRGKWAADGGMLINQGIHLVDLLQWFLGDVESVYGEIGKAESDIKETEDVAAGVLRFKNQALGMIEANIVTRPHNLGYSLTLFGDKGTICIEGAALNQITRWSIDGDTTCAEAFQPLLMNTKEETSMYENFIEAVRSHDKHVLVDGVEGKKALEIIFALYQSDLSKAPVRLPLKSFSTSNMCKKEGKPS